MIINFSEDDIPYDTAYRSYYWVSQSPDRRAEQCRSEYVGYMQSISDKFQAWVTEENSLEMTNDLEFFRSKYVRMFVDYLNSQSNVASQFVTGSGGWTERKVESNRRKGESAARKYMEWLDWAKKSVAKLENKYDPKLIASQPIRSDDGDALTKLREKLGELERSQELMKSANKIVRSKSMSEDKKIIELTQLVGAKAEELLKPDRFGRPGFASFQLTNNNATIKATRQRIEQLEREKSHMEENQGQNKEHTFGDVKVIENFEITRVQIIFPGKPDEPTRAILKNNGFRWAPSEEAWQRLLNNNGRYAANQVISKIAK